MKPYQILVFFLSVLLVLLSISLLFPAEGIRISDNIRLRYFQIDELFTEDTIEYADISVIIEKVDSDNVLKNEMLLNKQAAFDTIIHSPKINADSLKKIIYPIEFPQERKELFHSFFTKVSSLQSRNELLRIMHYGDSQIETDRITGYIRNKMQQTFGGNGCGLVPAVPLYNGKISISQEYSSNWKRFTGFPVIDSSLGHKRFGALLSYTSIRNSKNKKEAGWIELKPSPYAYPTSKKFNQLSLFIGKQDSIPLQLKMIINDSIAEERWIDKSFSYRKYQWKFANTPDRLRLVFSPDNNLNVYGVSLDNSWGIAVDNIPLRGSSGLEFSKTDTSLLKKMYVDLNVGMFILQFGGNVVPYLKSASTYERFFKRELRVLNNLLPGIPILVVGPSDMSIKEKGQYVTYPNLEKVRDALRSAALNSGCAFWDMYEAMGGKNSMPSWVFADPPLAGNDFVHFNTRGSRIIAEMLYNSIIYEYGVWRKEAESVTKQLVASSER